MCFHLKKWIIQKGIDYKKQKQPFNEAECELFSIPPEASPLINSSFFLGGHTVDGESLTMRFGFRNGSDAEIFIMYRHNGKLLFMEQDHYPSDAFPAQATCLEVGKRWRYTFDGTLRDTEGKRYTAAFDLLFTGNRPIYDFMQSADTFEGMTSAIAREKWNKAFFKELAEINSRHYEQVGSIEGWIEVEGQREALCLKAARDRAVGHRNWDYMNDHIWLNCVTDQGEALTFAIVSYPAIKNLFSGYTDFQTDRYVTLTAYDHLVYDHNQGLGSDHIEVVTHWSDGRTLLIQATRDENVFCSFDNGAFYFQEGVGNFLINGVAARGSIEYGFNRNTDRWSNFK